MILNQNKFLHICLLVGTVFFATACKQYLDPPVVIEAEKTEAYKKQRKVILIVVEGLSGTELAKYQPVNIVKVLKNAKYTYEGVADGDTGDAASWTTILSGTPSTSHGVQGNDFETHDEEDEDHVDHDNNSGVKSGYLTVFRRMVESGKVAPASIGIAPTSVVSETLIDFATHKILTDNDEQVKQRTIDTLLSGNPKIGFFVSSFNEVNQAGINSAFSIDEAAYKSAIDKVDGYIGEILQAIAERKSYGEEDWLVVITSTHGGIGNTYGGSSMEERMVPIIYHQMNLREQKYVMPPSETGFEASKSAYATMNNSLSNIYNIGTTGAYTIQLKLMNTKEGTLNGAIISKTLNTGNSDDGWSFIHNGPTGGWRLKVKSTQFTANKNFDLNKWYTLTARIYMDGTTRKAQVFTDDQLLSEGTLSTVQGSSTVDFNLGFSSAWSDGNARHVIKDLRIYDTALPVDHIQNNYCKIIDYEEDLYKNNLVGLWKMADGAGQVIHNEVPDKPHFTFKGDYNWAIYSSNYCKEIFEMAEGSKARYIYSYDIIPQVFYWLNIPIKSTWNLPGTVFLKEFEPEFIIR